MKNPVAFLCSLFLCGCATTRSAALPPALLAVRAECQALVASGKIPSIAIAVSQKGRVIWEEAFGAQDVEAHVPATVDTMYTLASTGKSVTGTVILGLAEKGRIDLDAPVDRYLAPGELTVYEGSRDRITVRTLLRMGVGIPHLWWHHWTDAPQAIALSNTDLLRRYAIVVTPPDGGFYYSNMTYGVLAQIAANVLHEPFAEVVRKEIFEPLGMTHVTLHPDEQFAPYLARSYGSGSKLRPYAYSDPEGGAGYRASIHDLIRYAMYHLGDHVHGQRPSLSATTLARNHTAPDGYFAGWGHVVDEGGVRFAIANGGIVGATSEIKLLPDEDIAVACLTNISGSDVSRIVDDALAAVEPKYRKKFVIPDQFLDHPFVADASLVGTWTGEVRTWERAVPASLLITAEGVVSLSLDGGDAVPVTKLRRQNGFIRGTCKCSVPVSDAAGAPTELDLNLRPTADRLFGSARVISVAPNSDFSLPAYMHLHRR